MPAYSASIARYGCVLFENKKGRHKHIQAFIWSLELKSKKERKAEKQTKNFFLLMQFPSSGSREQLHDGDGTHSQVNSVHHPSKALSSPCAPAAAGMAAKVQTQRSDV